MNLLNKVNSPKDIKGMSIEELKTLAQEIREVLITRVTETGGHMAPNLGFVEATLLFTMCLIRQKINLYLTYPISPTFIKC